MPDEPRRRRRTVVEHRAAGRTQSCRRSQGRAVWLDVCSRRQQIENDYEKEVYNGDIGTIDDVDSNSGELIASFDGRSVTYGFGELDMLVPAYAATIHKSQGSEYPAVVIPVLTQHYAMLQRNLLSTGVTRGKAKI